MENCGRILLSLTFSKYLCVKTRIVGKNHMSKFQFDSCNRLGVEVFNIFLRNIISIVSVYQDFTSAHCNAE